MKNIKVEKLPSGNYRIRKQINGKSIQVSFDHHPSQSEIIKALSSRADATPIKGSFEYCAEMYIDSKANAESKDKSVMSVSTEKGYRSILRALPADFKRMELSRITQIDIQKVISDYSKDHAPKTTRNVHGFISAVIKMFRPDMIIHTSLPQKDDKEPYTPSESDIRKILDASKSSKYHTCFLLGCLGLRRSEVCALMIDDIDVQNNTLTINKAMVYDKNNRRVIKKPKTAAGSRVIYIPDSLINEIMENRNENGQIFDGHPNRLIAALHSYQDRLNIPRFRFHDLRHFYASYAHKNGVSDANIMQTGGWRSMYTMQRIYRHAMDAQKEQKRIFDSIVMDDTN